MAGNDFVNVRLTAAGEALAAGGPLRFTARTTIVFTPGESTRIARYEWDLQLNSYHSADGQDLFELVTEAPAPEGQNEKENH